MLHLGSYCALQSDLPNTSTPYNTSWANGQVVTVPQRTEVEQYVPQARQVTLQYTPEPYCALLQPWEGGVARLQAHQAQQAQQGAAGAVSDGGEKGLLGPSPPEALGGALRLLARAAARLQLAQLFQE